MGVVISGCGYSLGVVVWEDSSSAQRAFLGKGVWPVLEEGVSEGSSPLWRKGPAGLLLRIATSIDVKKKGSRAKSDYYKKYGDPNSSDRERRKRPRNKDLRYLHYSTGYFIKNGKERNLHFYNFF